jgi:hypothetical protein
MTGLVPVFLFAGVLVGTRTGLPGAIPVPCFISMPAASNKVVASKNMFFFCGKQGESLITHQIERPTKVGFSILEGYICNSNWRIIKGQ